MPLENDWSFNINFEVSLNSQEDNINVLICLASSGLFARNLNSSWASSVDIFSMLANSSLVFHGMRIFSKVNGYIKKLTAGLSKEPRAYQFRISESRLTPKVPLDKTLFNEAVPAAAACRHPWR